MTRTAVVWSAGEPFSIEEVDIEDPRPDEVLVLMVAFGICQSDMSAAQGVGIVERAGDAVTLASVGNGCC